MISPRTGRVVKVVAGVSTGNGFALSPDAKDVYVVTTAGHAVEIRRISVATGKATVVADGAYPAVSPDGRYLAYATGSRFSKVAVRDLRTGRTRVIELRSLLGNGGNFLNQGQVTWLGDGSELIAVPGITASEAAAKIPARASSASAGMAGSDQLPPGKQTLIVIKVRPDGLAARRIVVPDPYQDPFLVISGDLSQERAVLIARMGYAAAGTITRVSLRGDGCQARVVARLPPRDHAGHDRAGWRPRPFPPWARAAGAVGRRDQERPPGRQASFHHRLRQVRRRSGGLVAQSGQSACATRLPASDRAMRECQPAALPCGPCRALTRSRGFVTTVRRGGCSGPTTRPWC